MKRPFRQIRFPTRFRLSTMLAMVVPFAIATMLSIRWYESRPIQWVPYSQSVFDERCKDGSPVIVFFSADWDANSKVTELLAFSDQRVIRLLRRNSVTAIRVDCTTPTPAVSDAYKQHGINTTPFVFVYFPDARDRPTVLRDLPLADDVLSAFVRLQPSLKSDPSG